MVVCNLLMSPLCNHYQTSQAPGMSTVECSRAIAICTNKLQPRSALQKFTKRSSSILVLTVKVYGSVMQSVHRQWRFALAMSDQEICRSSQGGQFISYMSHKQHTQVNHSEMEHNVQTCYLSKCVPTDQLQRATGKLCSGLPKPNCQAASPDGLICSYVVNSQLSSQLATKMNRESSPQQWCH